MHPLHHGPEDAAGFDWFSMLVLAAVALVLVGLAVAIWLFVRRMRGY